MLQEILCSGTDTCESWRDRRNPAIAGAQGCDRMRGIALRDQIAGTALASAALCGYAEFKLNFVKSHPGVRATGDFAVGDPVADANNHGSGRWAVEDGMWLIINTNLSHLQHKIVKM
jgi:hypothetical protein